MYYTKACVITNLGHGVVMEICTGSDISRVRNGDGEDTGFSQYVHMYDCSSQIQSPKAVNVCKKMIVNKNYSDNVLCLGNDGSKRSVPALDTHTKPYLSFMRTLSYRNLWFNGLCKASPEGIAMSNLSETNIK